IATRSAATSNRTGSTISSVCETVCSAGVSAAISGIVSCGEWIRRPRRGRRDSGESAGIRCTRTGRGRTGKTMNEQAYVHRADVMLADGTDPAAVGAMVTVALCGHWEHDGPCRWPHHNHIDGAHFRTIFSATPEEEAEVRRLIRAALHGHPGWRVLSDRSDTIATTEQELAAQLAQTPRRAY